MLPFNELRFNIAFRVLITLYGFSGLGNFFAHVPKSCSDDDEIFHFRHYNYNFWLITSLIFLFIGLAQFTYKILVFLTVAEIFMVIIIYIKLITDKQKYVKKQSKKLASVNKKRANEIKDRLL